ncbi:MAG: hypothetical protein GF405_03960 [Candidatus Eisenbacteria bacterium]|nr:hypothetical protein [Candidatus Eisenbacteria bacterium]
MRLTSSKEEHVFEAIAADTASSATVLVKRAAGELARAIEEIEADDPGSFWDALTDLASELVWAKRDMAPFVNLASDVLAAAERGVLSGAPPDALKTAAVSAAAETLEFADADVEHLAREAERALPPCTTAATLSTSAAVRAALERIAQRTERVVIAESRPALEGVELASRLAGTGISVRLVSDAAFPAELTDADVLLLGADAVTEQSFVNKTGSYPAALAAREADVPLFVLAQKSKIIPEALCRRPEPGDPAGLAPSRPEGVEVVNRLFEAVPLELVRAVITEDGLLQPDDLTAVLRARPVSPALLQMLFPKRPGADVAAA